MHCRACTLDLGMNLPELIADLERAKDAIIECRSAMTGRVDPNHNAWALSADALKKPKPVALVDQKLVVTYLDSASPCPFCGSVRIVEELTYCATCAQCGATGPGDDTPLKAVKLWNKRHHDRRPN